jgi:hypothetical protein
MRAQESNNLNGNQDAIIRLLKTYEPRPASPIRFFDQAPNQETAENDLFVTTENKQACNK